MNGPDKSPRLPGRPDKGEGAKKTSEYDNNWGSAMRSGDLERHNERPTVANNRRRVRVWFGRHVIADVTQPAAKAAQTEAGWRRRWEGLRVTNESLEPDPLAFDYAGRR